MYIYTGAKEIVGVGLERQYLLFYLLIAFIYLFRLAR